MHDFTPIPALIGGILIGLAATLLLIGSGEVLREQAADACSQRLFGFVEQLHGQGRVTCGNSAVIAHRGVELDALLSVSQTERDHVQHTIAARQRAHRQALRDNRPVALALARCVARARLAEQRNEHAP